MTKHLIVTADDFGLSPGVNRGILDAQRLGIVTGTSLMVNMPFADDAVRLAADAPELAVGLHLNLTGGVSLTSARHLVDERGCFLPLPRVVAAVVLSPRAAREAQVEWEAQAEAFLRLRPRVAALDSHHHLHMYPRLLEHALSLARRLDVPLRWPRDGFPLVLSDRLRVESAALVALAVFYRGRRRRDGVASTDCFAGLHLMGARFSVANLRRVIASTRPGWTELMCHPGRVDAELRARSSYAEPRAGELAVLTSPELRQAIAAAGVTLARWTDLKEAVA